MMISPESYYDLFIKGKTTDEIRTAIRSLKLEIARLKRTMEHPEYYCTEHIKPGEDVRIKCCREYLERARYALAEADAAYKPSRAELKAQAFDNRIGKISKVVLSIYRFAGGNKTITCTFDGDNVCKNTEYTFRAYQSEPEQTAVLPLNREEFLDEMRELHIGEWRTDYDVSRFGYIVLDGTQWTLEITYSDSRKPVSFTGSNSYPYNFSELLELLGENDFLTIREK